ncbi:uncharacterized protein LOC116224098 isoform X2 [Clupea harengus]|uniref:Uncharacterized protein LOC116224098 isoform X2 n=1 Tax=Clupea harengus TaxID=7950 RepID=A0A6P8GHS6_CLUHA|nr:uncharacterized protein LOC116224098 isoform X2 [Clupea harengus]
MYPHTLTQLDRWNPFSTPFSGMHQNEQPVQGAPEEAHPKRKLPSVDYDNGEAGEFVHWSEEVQWFEDQLEEKKEGAVANGKASWHTTRILTRAMVANSNGIQKAFGQQNKEIIPNGIHGPKDIKLWMPLWAKLAGFLVFGVLTGCLLYIFQVDEIVSPPPVEEVIQEPEDTGMFTWEWISIVVAETVGEFIFLTKSLFSIFLGGFDYIIV